MGGYGAFPSLNLRYWPHDYKALLVMCSLLWLNMVLFIVFAGGKHKKRAWIPSLALAYPVIPYLACQSVWHEGVPEYVSYQGLAIGVGIPLLIWILRLVAIMNGLIAVKPDESAETGGKREEDRRGNGDDDGIDFFHAG